MASLSQHINTEQLTFGVEIEFYTDDWGLIDLVDESFLSTSGIGYLASALGLRVSDLSSGWSLTGDDSLSSEWGWDGLELVSPPLCGAEGLEELLKVVGALKDMGCTVQDGESNDSCGAHVHVGIDSILDQLEPQHRDGSTFLERVLKVFSQHEHALFAIGGVGSRIDGDYAQSVKRAECHQGNLKGKTVDDYVQQDFTRYRTLNFKSLSKHGTLEFRIFAGSLEPVDWLGYVLTALGICQRAAESGTVHGFDTRTEVTHVCGDFESAVERLHRQLNWKCYRTNRLSHKCGFWSQEDWAKYGVAILRRQREQARKFAMGVYQ